MHLSSDDLVDLHSKLTRAWHDAPETSMEQADPWLIAVAFSIAPTSTCGTLRTKPAPPARRMRNWPP
jgi:hypothetical protein